MNYREALLKNVFLTHTYLYICRHRSEDAEEIDGPMGSVRINGSQIDTKVEYATVPLSLTTCVEEMLGAAIKQFATKVSKISILSFQDS